MGRIPRDGTSSNAELWLLYGPLTSGFLDPSNEALGIRTDDSEVEFTDSFGYSALLNAGDMDGDGLDDLIVGAPRDSTNGEDAGAIWILFAEGLNDAAGR